MVILIELAVGNTRSALRKRIRPSVRSRIATPMTPSSRLAISSTRVSSFFQSKSLPVSRGASDFCWPKAALDNASVIANANNLILHQLPDFSLSPTYASVLDHLGNSRLGERCERVYRAIS